MNLLPLARNLWQPRRNRRTPARTGRPDRTVPRLELLEERTVLSTVIGIDAATRTEVVLPSDPLLDSVLREFRVAGFDGVLDEQRQLPNGTTRDSVGREELRDGPGIRTIFGPDDRSRVTATTSYPWRTVGRLATGCSGAMVSPYHFLTAGHCVHGGQGQGWYNNLQVALGQNDATTRPYGVANWTYVRTYNAWTSSSDWNWDFALITLDRRVGNSTGWLGREWNSSDSYYNGLYVNSAGYPGDKPLGTMWAMSGPISFATTHRVFFNGTMDIMGGQSGSSIWRTVGDSRYVTGVVTHHAGGNYPNHNSGTRMTQAKFNDVTNWIDQDNSARPPTDLPDFVDYDSWYNTRNAYFSPSVVQPGDRLTARSVVSNLGSANAGSFQVSFYASTNTTITTGDYLIGSVTLSSLSAYNWADALQTFTFPDMPAGQYYVGWIFDPTDAVREYNDSDNTGVITSSTLTVRPRNQPPVAVGDVYAVNEDTILAVGFLGVLANDRDPEGSALSAVLVTGPRHGALTLNPDGTFVYVPRANFHGTDTFTYQASDGSLVSGPATVILTVNPVNDAPTALDDAFNVNEDENLNTGLASVLHNDTDVDGDALRAILAEGPQHGTLTLNADGTFSYTPHANFNGSDSFRYRATDGALESALATVTITVQPVNDAPVLSALTPPLAYRGRPYSLTVIGTDVDGDRLTYSLEPGAPAGLGIDPASGVLSWTPRPEHGGRSFTVTVRATESTAARLSATQTFTISVRNPGRFQLSADAFLANEGNGAAVITITRTDGDSPDVSVRYCTRENNAQPWTCHGTVTFAQGDTQKTATIPLTNDDRATLGHTLQVRLENPTGGAELGTLTTALVQVTDDDLPVVPDRAPPAKLSHAALGFAKSREQFTNLVIGAYNRYLKRNPDPVGLEAWVTNMLNGKVTEEQLEAGFIGSAEYIAQNGGRGRGWVIGMYKDLLGRDPSEAEIQAWVQKLANGVSETDVAYGFAASLERQGQRVQRNYRTYLDRDASPAEVAAWVERFRLGLATNQDIVAGFIGSPEYYHSPSKGRGNPAVWIVRAYEQVLFRAPARAEVENWLRFFDA